MRDATDRNACPSRNGRFRPRPRPQFRNHKPADMPWRDRRVQRTRTPGRAKDTVLGSPLTISGKGCARQAEEGDNFKALIFYYLITQAIERLPVGPVFSQIILQVVKGNNKEVPIRCRSALFSAGYLKKIAPTLPQTLRNARSKSGAAAVVATDRYSDCRCRYVPAPRFSPMAHPLLVE